MGAGVLILFRIYNFDILANYYGHQTMWALINVNNIFVILCVCVIHVFMHVFILMQLGIQVAEKTSYNLLTGMMQQELVLKELILLDFILLSRVFVKCSYFKNKFFLT